jgi:hypothetical protein
MNVQQLKNLGYQVKIIHNRRMEVDYDNQETYILPRGGATNAVLQKDGRVYDGVAICSDKDNYCKDTGRKVALARAMAKCEFLREKVPNLFL